MIVIRYAGYALFCWTLVLSGVEAVKYLETRTLDLIAVAEAWRYLGADSLEGFEAVVRDSHFPGLWDDVMRPVISVPLLVFSFLASVILLIVVGRHKSTS